jgi:hypothetical protein
VLTITGLVIPIHSNPHPIGSRACILYNVSREALLNHQLHFVQWNTEGQRKTCSKGEHRKHEKRGIYNLEDFGSVVPTLKLASSPAWLSWTCAHLSWDLPTALQQVLSCPSPPLNRTLLEDRDHVLSSLYPSAQHRAWHIAGACWMNEWEKSLLLLSTDIKWPHKLVGRIKWEMHLDKIQRILKVAALLSSNKYYL